MADNPEETSVRYIAISPVRNEERYIKGVLDSMTRQTILPIAWVIVDDSSNDQTARIVEEYARDYPFIRLIRREPDRQAQHGNYDGLAVAADAKAFNYGLSHVQDLDYEYIVRIEADTSFGHDYFERLLNEFNKDERLGLAGGRCLVPKNGTLALERVPDWHVWGGTKTYRRQCFEQIGGLVEYLGWEFIDETRAQMHGWRTRNFKDIQIVHLRPMGSSGSIVAGRIRHGKQAYVVGYHPLFMLLRSILKMREKPYVLSGVLMFWGFCMGYVHREKQFPDPELRRYLRTTQVQRLLGKNPMMD